jgi:hypothetical protein
LSDIYGIWFYEKTDCEKVGRKVEQLVQEVEARLQARQAAAAGGGDLAQMLQVRYRTQSQVSVTDPDPYYLSKI